MSVTGSNNAHCCKRCKLKGVNCSDCDNYFHLSCAKLSKTVHFVNEEVIKCCSGDGENDEEKGLFNALNDMADNDKKVDIRIVKFLLQQKECVITELKEKVQILLDHVEFLTKHVQPLQVNLPATSLDVVMDVVVPSTSFSIDLSNSEVSRSKKSTNSDLKPSVEKSRSVDSEKQKQTMTCVGSKDSSWSEVVRRKQKRTIVVGNNNKSDTGIVKLKGVAKTVSLHVYRLSPSTTVDQVEQFLKADFPEVKCEKLNSRQPDVYSSFKVDVYEDNLEAVMNPNIWPNNTYIRRFLYPRQTLTVNKK